MKGLKAYETCRKAEISDRKKQGKSNSKQRFHMQEEKLYTIYFCMDS